MGERPGAATSCRSGVGDLDLSSLLLRPLVPDPDAHADE